MKRPRRLFKERRDSSYDSTRRYYTAVHEAGHAVSALVLGLGLRWVDIKRRQLPDGNYSLGITNARDLANQEILGKGEDAVRPILVHALAGLAAEAWVNPGVSTLDYQTASRDWADAWRYAIIAVCEYVETGNGRAEFSEEEQVRCQPRLQALMESARDEALRLVEEHRAAITEVADLLMRKTRVEGNEVAAIVNAVPC